MEFNSGRVNLMIDLFSEMATFFKENLAFSPEELEEPEDTNETENTESDSKENPTTTKKFRKGQLITNRKDTVKVINEVCRWFKENEPSSFAVSILENAIDVIGKDPWESMTSLGGFANKSLNKMASASGGRSPLSNETGGSQTGTKSEPESEFDKSIGIKLGDGMPPSQVVQGKSTTGAVGGSKLGH